jgi:hypothetical protein
MSDLISFCIPVMDRLSDLRETMPHTIRAAVVSPPCEILALDYGSRDDLLGYLQSVARCAPMLRWCRVDEPRHYHKAHAWNVAERQASGDWLVFMGADAILSDGYVPALRKLIADGCTWMRGRHYKGIVCVQRDEFLAAGGYDERFEFSGEDKEFDERLRRRGGKFGLVPDGLVKVIRTPNPLKFANARGNPTKKWAIAHGEALRKENEAAGLLVANQGKEWGTWE